MNEQDKVINTLMADCEMLSADIHMLQRLYIPLMIELRRKVPRKLRPSVFAFTDLLNRMVVDAENCYFCSESEGE